MADPQQVQWRDVQKVLSGQPMAQVTFAQNVVMVGANQGGVINIAPDGQQAADRIRARLAPPHILPRTVPGFVDRDEEQGHVSRALARRQVVDVHGPDGMGKTALISQTMQTALPDAFPDGLVYLQARSDSYEDLLQDLFRRFFETDGRVKVTENDVQDYMSGKQALIAVDDANYLKEREGEHLAQVAPQCALLVAGLKQQVWGATPVPLQGLPRDEAVALFERHWGPVSTGDRATVEAICDALGNVPLPIVKAATIAVTRQVPLGEMLHWLQRRTGKRDPTEQVFQVIARRLSEGEQRLLGGLAAPGGASVGFDELASISGLSQERVNRYLARLQKMGLVHATDSRYSLDDGLRRHIRGAWVDESMRARAAECYRQKAGQLRARSKDPDEDNVMAALGYYLRRKQWRQVVEIVRAADSYLATACRWGQWRRRLNQAWHAARKMGDRAAEAWSQNQLGIVALGAGDKAAAAGFFKGALGIWQALGDQVGETIARWNLQVLLGPPPLPPKGKPPAKPGGGLSPLTLAMGGVATVLIIVVIVLAGLIPPDGPTPTPPESTTPPPVVTTITPSPTPRTPTVTPSHTPRTPTLTPTWSVTPSRTPTPTPTPTTSVPPYLTVWLAAGCDQEYEPGSLTRIYFRPNVDGRVAIWLDGQEQILETEVKGNQTYGADWSVVEEPGGHYLRAVLEVGFEEDDDVCSFSVATPAPTDDEGPTIGDVVVNPSSPTTADEIVIAADVTDDESGVAGVEAWYWYRSAESEWVRASMAMTWMGVYGVSLGTLPEGGFYYYIRAWDSVGNVSQSGTAWQPVEEADTQGPTISGTFVSPPDPTFSDEIGIGTYITDTAGVSGAELWFRLHPDYGAVWSWRKVAMQTTWLGEDLWAGIVGRLDKTGDLEYFIVAWDGLQNQSKTETYWQYVRSDIEQQPWQP